MAKHITETAEWAGMVEKFSGMMLKASEVPGATREHALILAVDSATMVICNGFPREQWKEALTIFLARMGDTMDRMNQRRGGR